MTTEGAPGLRGAAEVALAIARSVTAVIVSGAVAAVIFLVMIQGSFRKGYTELDFSHVLGTLVQGEAEEARSGEALGVIGDTAGPAGLYATLLAGIAVMALHALVIARLRRHWALEALPLAVITFLLLGLVYAPVADARFDTPIGIFGTDGGGVTPLVLGLSALGFALVGARCYGLVAGRRWWEPKEEGLAGALESLAAPEEDRSLELAEEGPEQRRVGP